MTIWGSSQQHIKDVHEHDNGCKKFVKSLWKIIQGIVIELVVNIVVMLALLQFVELVLFEFT